MTFSDTQLKHLRAKLDRGRVKQREHDGRDVAYVEGWYVMAEANRIFGFDGWDRITLPHQLLYERPAANGQTECAYIARVRVVVRAEARVVVREGSGVGSATRANAGEAHDIALKTAETDATKRALATFGNRFGLALYDKDQAGVTKLRPSPLPTGDVGRSIADTPRSAAQSAASDGKEESELRAAAVNGVDQASADAMQSALIYLKAVRERIVRVASAAELEECLASARAELDRLRKAYPDLRNRRGVHFCDLVVSVAELRSQDLARGSNLVAAAEPLRLRIDKAQLKLATAKRYRDKDHLKAVAGLPCLVCGRAPSQAHHLRFAQDRGLGLKVSDQFTVPLCAIDHDALHRFGDEQAWWTEKKIDPLPHAARLWAQSRAVDGGEPLTAQNVEAEAGSENS